MKLLPVEYDPGRIPGLAGPYRVAGPRPFGDVLRLGIRGEVRADAQREEIACSEGN